MNKNEVLALFDRQLRRDARPDGPGVRVERAGAVVRQVGPQHAWNGVLWSGLDQDDAEAAIAEQVRFYGSLGLEFEWKLYGHDRPADLADRLVADLDITAEPPEGVRLVEVEVEVADRAGVESLAEVHELAFGAGAGRLRDHLLERLDDDTVVPVLAVAGGRPVSAARLDLYAGTSTSRSTPPTRAGPSCSGSASSR